MRKILLICTAIIVLLLLSNNIKSEEIVIPNESIRIRVIANSNSIKDQNIKKRVKKSVQVQLTELLKDAKSIEEVRTILKNSLGDVGYTVEETLKDEDNKKYSINYGYNFFPQKLFKGIEYKEGLYESVVIRLGESKGDNWWCVLFPPLCLLEDNSDNVEEVEYKSFVKELIDKYF